MYFCVNEDEKIIAVFDDIEEALTFADQCLYQDAAWDAVAQAGDAEAPESAFLAGFYGSGIEIIDSEQWDDRLMELIEDYLEENLVKIMSHRLIKAVQGVKFIGNVNWALRELRELSSWELVCMLAILYCLSENCYLNEEMRPDYKAIIWKLRDCIDIFDRFEKEKSLFCDRVEEKLEFFL